MSRGKRRKAPRSVAPFDPRKRPTVANPATLRAEKRPKSAIDQEQILSFRPSWRLGHLEIAGPFGWEGVQTLEKMQEILEKLRNLESMTWREILVDGKRRNHHNSVETLSPAARKELARLLPGEDELLSLRLAGEERIYGILQDQGAMLILWWDPKHKVCPSPKKHT